MAFRTRRQTRYNHLREKGFLPFEASALSKVPRKIPYMVSVVRARSRVYNQAKKEDWSQAGFERYIKELYARKGWTTLTRAGRETLSPWAMLRDYEDRYKDKHPDYTSPWLKKQKHWRDFMTKYERGEEKYPRGAHY